MENTIEVGLNRTGLDMAPLARNDMVRYAREEGLNAPADVEAYAETHRRYTAEADRVGSVPVPARLKGMATTVVSRLKGDKPEVLIDKLGERLAFERTGTRLYEAVILKFSAVDNGLVVDTSALQRIRDDEESHFHMVSKYLAALGADPTAMTPCADVAGVASLGLLQVVADPRTTVSQALQAVLTAELADNDGWELLIELAQQTGHSEMAQAFAVALEAEAQHLLLVRGWLRKAVLQEAT